MFFLKISTNGLKKNNIIFVENFVDPQTKINLNKNGYKCEQFHVHDSVNKLTKDIKKAQYIYDKFTRIIKLKIEKFSNKKINSKIIHLILSKWFFYYISNSYYKFKVLKEIKRKYPKFSLINIKDKEILEEDKYLYAPNSTLLNFHLMKNIGIQQSVKITQVKFYQIQELIFFYPSPVSKHNKLNLSFLIKLLFSKVSIMISKMFYKNTIYIHDDVLNFLNILKLILKSKFRFSYLFFLEKNPNEDINISDFNYLKIEAEEKFEKILSENFFIYLPKSILLLIKQCNLMINKKMKLKSKDFIISKRFYGAGYFYFKKYIIENISQKNLISFQHGGSYGQEKFYFPEKAEKLISDFFASWGWRGKNVFTLPVPLKESNKKMNFKNKSSYILFSTISCNWNFFSYPNNPEMIPNFQMKPTFDFLSKISKKKSVILRLPPYRHVWREKDFFGRIKKIKIDDHNNSFEYMATHANLVIHNHFNTTALETLSWNIPTLIFNHRKLQHFNPKADKFLNKLVKANVFFYSQDKLLNFLRKNNFDMRSWWSQKKVQDARRNFCKNYCHRSIDWQEEWISTLKNIGR